MKNIENYILKNRNYSFKMPSTTQRCIFKFHPIGQGCFFTGSISTSSFNFVYDCGSKTAGSFLSDSIEAYLKQLPTSAGKQVIDLLIISHFDEDHVNGVFELLKTVKLKTLVIPYISIAERLSIFSRGDAKTESHREFLDNPQNFLNSDNFDIVQVIIVGAGANVQDRKPVKQPLSDESNQLIAHAPLVSAPGLPESGMQFGDKFQYFQIPFALKLKTWEWTFKFYVSPINQELVRNFELEVYKAYPGQPLNDLFNDSERLKLKGIYKRIFGDINKTSLCVSVRKDDHDFVNYHDHPNLYFDYNIRKATLLLTGDSSLISHKEVSAFTDYYKAELPGVLVYQIPHHGSDYNSNLDPASLLWNFPLYVINHGYGRSKHPGKKLNLFTKAFKKNVWNATEHQYFYLEYDIH